MNNKKIIKLVLSSFIQEIWKMKFIWISFFWLIFAIMWMMEPFFYTKIIELIEIWFKTGIYSFNSFALVFILWWIFIISTSIIFFVYRYYLIDSNVLDFHESIYRKWSSKIIWMKYWEYLNKKQWSLFKKFDRWITDQFNLLFFIFLDLIKNIWWTIIIILILFIIDFRMAFATLWMLPVMIWLWYYFNSRTNKLQKEVNKDWDKSYWYMWDAISNIWLVKTLVLEEVFWKLMSNIDKKTIKKQKKVSKRWSIADIYTWLLVMISRFLVLSYWIYLLSIWEITFATLFLYFSFIWYIYFPIWFIFWRLRNIQEQLTSIWNFYDEFWDLESDKIVWSNEIKIKKLNWNIKFENVLFSYTKWIKILKNLNFEINPWEKIAFVWNTGAWKSTIINLLFRFWDTKSWAILLDWINIKNIRKDSLRRHIWLVAQDNSLFNVSIKENLLFANKNATKKEIEIALKNAQAEFVFDLEKGINTIIWERWLKLSWWEKQRLSIARLFLKNPEILILDEATSALDNKTEKLVQKALDKLMKWRTSIVIAHRLSTIQNADKIFMLESWKIVEAWDYNELMANKWKFYELANPEHLILN